MVADASAPELTRAQRAMLRRRRVLERRNAGESVASVAVRLGVTPSEVSRMAQQARVEASMFEHPIRQLAGPVAEPLLDWLQTLPLDAAGWSRGEVFDRAAAAMGHEVSEPVLLRKLRDSRCRFGSDGRLALRG